MEDSCLEVQGLTLGNTSYALHTSLTAFATHINAKYDQLSELEISALLQGTKIIIKLFPVYEIHFTNRKKNQY
jgi:hypothetical protein